MRRKSTRRYSGYKGRTSTSDKLQLAAGVLLILVLLAAAGLFVGQRYIVYTDDGLRLELPFMQRDEQKDAPEDLGDISVVVQPGEREPVEQPRQFWLKAVEMDIGRVLDGTALTLAGEQDANAIILDMKTDWGRLAFASEQPLAAHSGGDTDAWETNEKLAALAREDIYLIARVSCFKDHALAEDHAYAIETNPGRRWNDLDGVRWSSPANEAVQKYVLGMVEELAQLGFDEILLDSWGYPTAEDGYLEYIKKGDAYRPGELDAVITPFLEKAAAAVEKQEVVLSVTASVETLEGSDRESGQNLEQIKTHAGRVWLEPGADSAAALKNLARAGVERAEEYLVEAVSELDKAASVHQRLYHTEVE